TCTIIHVADPAWAAGRGVNGRVAGLFLASIDCSGDLEAAPPIRPPGRCFRPFASVNDRLARVTGWLGLSDSGAPAEGARSQFLGLRGLSPSHPARRDMHSTWPSEGGAHGHARPARWRRWSPVDTPDGDQ